jgi:hypothetical protein
MRTLLVSIIVSAAGVGSAMATQHQVVVAGVPSADPPIVRTGRVELRDIAPRVPVASRDWKCRIMGTCCYFSEQLGGWVCPS